jgi:hypothetical protein
MNSKAVRVLSDLILRLSCKMGILAACGDEVPRRAHGRAPEVYYHSVERCLSVRQRGIGNQSATGINGALPDVLAARIRLHLSARLLDPRRSGSHTKFLRHAA